MSKTCVVAYVLVFLGAAFVIITCAGCAVVGIHTPQWNVMGASLFKDINVRPIRIDPDGAVESQGYRSGVDGEALGKAAGEAGKAIIR